MVQHKVGYHRQYALFDEVHVLSRLSWLRYDLELLEFHAFDMCLDCGQTIVCCTFQQDIAKTLVHGSA